MRLAAVDGVVVPLSEASIPVADEGLLRGDGVFEVMRLYGGTPFGLDSHMARMRRSAANLRLEIDEEALRRDIAALLERSGEREGLVRALVTRGGRRVVLIEDLPDLGESMTLGFVTYSPSRILDGVKSLSYAANMLAARLAREAGHDDALLVTPHGRVLEASTASFFWVRDGEVFTPGLDEHILDSITRRVVIETSGARERVCTREDALAADEAFLASTVREVLAVRRIEDVELPAQGPVTARAAEAVHARIADLSR